MSTDPPPVTELLERAQGGDDAARERLFEQVYSELRRIASGHVARSGGGPTLQATALVHEAYLRLVKVEDASYPSRHHFYALASRVMRGLLVDYARERGAEKRQSPEMSTRVGWNDDAAISLLDFGLALEELSAIDAELAELAELRYLGGLQVDEIATLRDAKKRTVERRLQVANSWLRNRFDGS